VLLLQLEMVPRQDLFLLVRSTFRVINARPDPSGVKGPG